MKKIFSLGVSVRVLLFTALLSAPVLALAQVNATEINTGLGTIGGIVDTFTSKIVTSLAKLFATMAMVAFFWGIVQYIWGAREGDATKKKNGNQFMIWGLIALFVMFSVWGIITYAQRIFGIEGRTDITIPTINLGTGSGGAGSGGAGNGGLPSGGNANGCTHVNTPCTTSNGQPGSCVQGGAARDYMLYCSQN